MDSKPNMKAREFAAKENAKKLPEKNWQDRRNIKGEKRAQDGSKISVKPAEGIDRVKMRKGDLKAGQGGKMGNRK
jgi:hypothetical protein